MKNKPSLAFYTLLLTCFALILSLEKASAQEYGIYELTNNTALSKTKEKKSNDRDGFYKLVQNLHTTAYLNNNTIKVYGKDKIQKVVLSNSKSFGLLNNDNFTNVELITLTLKEPSDFNNKLDLIANKNLANLKYVFITCYFKFTPEQIEKFITANSNIRVFYSTEIPS